MPSFTNWFKIRVLKQDLRSHQLHPYIQVAIEHIIGDFNYVKSECVRGNKDIPVFNEFGSDKDSRHSYGSTYFALLKDRVKPSILEIGVGSFNNYPYAGNPPGGGLLTFRKYYPNALLIGADIDPEAIKILLGHGIIGFHLDQTSKLSLEDLKSKIIDYGEFDLIIDDGLHEPHANVLTMLQMYDLVKPGGHYVIEDVHKSLINFWRIIAVTLPDKIEILDMSQEREGVNDNVLVIFHKDCPN